MEDHDQAEKRDRLKKSATLNRTPENVSAPMFAADDCFDARDLLQVRYEMVRRVRRNQATLAQAAARFGVSRATCFRMVKSFDRGGLQGLIPAGVDRAGRTRSPRRCFASSTTTGPGMDVSVRADGCR